MDMRCSISVVNHRDDQLASMGTRPDLTCLAVSAPEQLPVHEPLLVGEHVIECQKAVEVDPVTAEHANQHAISNCL